MGETELHVAVSESTITTKYYNVHVSSHFSFLMSVCMYACEQYSNNCSEK